jgi:hypothetical protein
VKGALGNLVRSIFTSKWHLVNIKLNCLIINAGNPDFLNNSFLSHSNMIVHALCANYVILLMFFIILLNKDHNQTISSSMGTHFTAIY